MTRYKKIQEEILITSLIYQWILEHPYFVYWIDIYNLSYDLYVLTDVPQHRIRKYFYKNIFPWAYHSNWVNID